MYMIYTGTALFTADNELDEINQVTETLVEAWWDTRMLLMDAMRPTEHPSAYWLGKKRIL